MNTMWRATVVFLGCSVFALGVMAEVWQFRAPELVGTTVVGLLAMSLFLVATALTRSNRAAERISSILFFFSALIWTYLVALNHEFYFCRFLPFEPFIGFKLLAIFLCLICPPSGWATWSSFAIWTIVPLQRYFSWTPEARASLGIQEPWVTVVVVILAGAIHIHRRCLLTLRTGEVEMATKVRLLRRLTHLLIGMQHLLNTPLQTVELLTLSYADPTLRVRLDNAFAAIRRVTKILSLANEDAEWRDVALPEDSAELEAEFRQLIREH